MNAPLRVAYISHSSYLGGGEISLLTLLGSLPRDRVEPVLFSSEKGDLTKEAEMMRISIVTAQLGALEKTVEKIRAYFQLKKIFRNEQIRLVHTNGVNVLACAAARRLRIPLVVHARTIHPLPRADRWCVRRADRVVAISQAVRDHLIEEGVKPEQISVIPNGLDLAVFDEACTLEGGKILRRELGIPLTAFTLCFLGRLDPWKGLSELFTAVEALNRPGAVPNEEKIHLIIAGEVPKSPEITGEYKNYKRTLVELARVLGIEDQIHFVGFRRDVGSVVAASNVLVLPTYREAFGRAIVEGMAGGLPVVASNVGGIPEVVEDGVTGLLVPPRSSEELTAALMTLLKDPEKMTLMGEAGRHRARRFYTKEAMTTGILDLYRGMALL